MDSLLGICLVVWETPWKGVVWIDREDDPEVRCERSIYCGVPTGATWCLSTEEV